MKMDYESIAIDHSAIDAETEFEPYLENSSKPPFIIPKEFSNFTISKNVCNRKKKKKEMESVGFEPTSIISMSIPKDPKNILRFTFSRKTKMFSYYFI